MMERHDNPDISYNDLRKDIPGTYFKILNGEADKRTAVMKERSDTPKISCNDRKWEVPNWAQLPQLPQQPLS
jgi:ribosomal protein S12